MHPQMLPPGWSSFDSRAVEAFAGRDPNVVDNVPRRNALRYAGLPSSQQRTTNPYTTSRFEVGSSVPVNHTAPPARRLYLDTRVDVDARAPLGGVGQRVDRPVRRRRSAPALWPWLKQRSYATGADDEELERFLLLLGRRAAHLRPGLRLVRTW